MTELSINSLIDWRQVLPMLGIDAEEKPLPMVVTCPLCRGPRLTIFDDTRFGGNWHHCLDCNTTGGMIALAAKAWKYTIPETIRKLADCGATIDEKYTHDKAIAKYEKYFSGMQDEADRLAVDSRKLLHSGKVNVQYVLQQSGFGADQKTLYWPKRMGRFMGAAGRLRIYQSIFNKPDETNFDKMHRQRLLSGKGWRDVVTIPFHSLPGQTSGWLFIGKRGAGTADHAFHIFDGGYARPTAESGLCMYDVLDTPTAYKDKFGDNVFVFNNPLTALQLQGRHMRDSELPLPLVASYNAKQKRIRNVVSLVVHDLWKTRPDKKFIFWGPALSADVFNMAARADGQVFIGAGPTHVRNYSPHGCLSHIQKHARYWMVALEEHMARLPEDTAVTFLNSLNLGAERLKRFRAGCSDGMQRLLDRNRGRVKLMGSITVKGKDIIETPLGWAISGKMDECISNAVIRIDKVLCSTDESIEPIYAGRILLDGEEYEFQETMDVIEKNPANWLKKKMLAVASKLVVVKQNWSLQLLDIARQFHEPQIIREDGKFGWKPRDGCFVLPQFSVRLGGEVNAESAYVVDEWTPGRELVPPAQVPDMAALLADTPSNRLFWATMTCIVANITAPAVGQVPCGVGVIGHGALMLGRASARAAGCCEYKPGGSKPGHTDKVTRQMEMITRRHGWPLIVMPTYGGSSKSLLHPWFNGDNNRNVVLHMRTEYEAAMAAVLGPWRFIREATPIEAGPEVRMYGRYVISAWLQWICQRKLDVSGDQSYIGNVNHHLATMMASYGAPDVVWEGGRLIDEGSDHESQHAPHYAYLLWQMIEAGDLKFVHADDMAKTPVPKIILISDEDTPPSVFVGRDTVNSLLVKRGITLPDNVKVTEALRIGNALDRECEYNGEIGWLLYGSWWDQQIEHFRSSRRLQVIGGT